MSKEQEKKERLEQIEKGTYVDRQDVQTDIDKQRGIKRNV